VPCLLDLLKGENRTVSTAASLELSQLLIFSMKAGHDISGTLLEEFEKKNGYSIITSNLCFVGKSGTREERVFNLVTFYIYVVDFLLVICMSFAIYRW
jgi:hypothetical protein